MESKGVPFARPFVILNQDQDLPSGFLRFIGPGRWATLNDNTILILRLARISEKFRLRMRDIAIELLQLVRNRLTTTGYFVPVFPGSHVVIVGRARTLFGSETTQRFVCLLAYRNNR
jgi:hypothetical protein